VHEATWDEIMLRYGHTPHRRALLDGLRRALNLLRSFGCRRVYLNGSFVTEKERPGDYDACWEAHDVDIMRLVQQEPLLWDDSPGRPNQKLRFGGDLFPVRVDGDRLDRVVLDDFQVDVVSQAPKGIVVLNLEPET
jgi:hypothetical protein